MHILVIEDDRETREFVARGLDEAGHTVDTADNGRDGLLLASTGSFDVIVLDRMLPELDGLAVLRTLRAADNHVPVLLLSALGEVDQRVQGLRAGGDDYLTKPFAFSEARSAHRSAGTPYPARGPQTVLRAGDLEMDLMARTVHRGGRRSNCSRAEFRLLEFLLRHAGQVVTRTMLLEHVWDYHFDPQTNVIDVHISRLRAKIDRGFDEPLLHTVRGAGYRLAANAARESS